MKRKPKKVKNLFDYIRKDKATRIAVTKQNHQVFFSVYFSHFVKYKTGLFQKEIFNLTEDQSIPLVVLCSFRNSGKSTINTLSYPIWGILGEQQKKFILIVSQVKEQAALHFKNLKTELETNQLLKEDLGPFRDDSEWNAQSIFIKNYNARIVVASKEQAIRGIKHGSFRPDLIIVDDPDDLSSVKTQESRDATYNWFTSEILPLGDNNTKVVVSGNMLHQDCLLMRLKTEIAAGIRSGIYREYPIITDEGAIMWPGKFPNIAAIEAERKRIGDKFSWSREYLLKIIDDYEPVISKDWIGYYRELPEPLRGQHFEYAMGIDLAISERDSADFTAIVSCKIIGSGDNRRIYILPNPINERMQIPKIIDKIKIIAKSYGRYSTSIYVEEVMLQGYLTQLLKESCFRAEGLQIHGLDKKTRLGMTAIWIFNKWILFPEKGAERLLDQLLNFGTTKHDDLVDAFTVLILKIIEKEDSWRGVAFIQSVGLYEPRPEKRQVSSRQRISDALDQETREMFANHGQGIGYNSVFSN